MPDDLKQVIVNLPTDRAYLVGGCVRDHFLGLTPKDFDIEVYGMNYEQLAQELEKYGKLDLVGKAFAVIKVTLPSKEIYDFSLPRRDNKTGVGHKDFVVEADGDITEREGATRRDLTINALSWNPKTGEVFDPFNGLEDIEKGILRHTSAQFSEDPLRPLRIFQFAARFNFTVAEETKKLCQGMADMFHDLPPERVREEFEKFLLKGKDHNAGFRALKEMGWSKNFPELHALYNLPQDIEFHPEGDAITHTGHCLIAIIELLEWNNLAHKDKIITALGVLTHDLGKATTTKIEFKKRLNRNCIVSPGHDKEGEAPTKSLLQRIGFPELSKKVIPLVTHHMDHLTVKTDAEIRRLAVQLEPNNIATLSFITKADHSGRPPLPKKQPKEMVHIIERAHALGCHLSKQPNFLTGDYILKESQGAIPQGKAIGILLSAVYEAQTKGAFTDTEGAKTWYQKNRGRILENAKVGPKRILGGDELTAANMPKGELFGNLHRDLYTEQLTGNIKTKNDALEFLKNNSKKYGLTKEILQEIQNPSQKIT